MNCYSGYTNKSGTTKDEQDNRVTAHEPVEKVKVSCLQNRADAADMEDAADTEQKAETKITRRSGGTQQYFTRRSKMLLFPDIRTLLRPMSKSDGCNPNTGGSRPDTV